MNETYLYLDRILYPVTALGPGKRIVIWVAGCTRKCPGCANPELWVRHDEQKIDVKLLADVIRSSIENGCDGLTITGGEPFDQSLALVQMIRLLKPCPEVLIFTGYLKAELMEDKEKSLLAMYADVIVDGPYIKEKNDGKAVLRGSINQSIHYRDEDTGKRYKQYLEQGRKIENFVYEYNTLSVGIHNP